MITPQTSDIVMKVMVASRDGKLDWRVSETPSGGFTADLGTTLLWCYTESGYDYLEIRDRAGHMLVKTDPFTDTYMVSEIIGLARRKALKVDDRLKELSQKLDSL